LTQYTFIGHSDSATVLHASKLKISQICLLYGKYKIFLHWKRFIFKSTDSTTNRPTTIYHHSIVIDHYAVFA